MWPHKVRKSSLLVVPSHELLWIFLIFLNINFTFYLSFSVIATN